MHALWILAVIFLTGCTWFVAHEPEILVDAEKLGVQVVEDAVDLMEGK